jgi:hypothetical protein
VPSSLLLSAAQDFVTNAGGLVGGGAALGGMAGFVGWGVFAPLYEFFWRRRHPDEDPLDSGSLGAFVTVGAGIGGVRFDSLAL